MDPMLLTSLCVIFPLSTCSVCVARLSTIGCAVIMMRVLFFNRPNMQYRTMCLATWASNADRMSSSR
uniref:Putative secreted peptide n=1 Tax=Anopheles braziliensis TaxID=58242 RepID=A0A2M3ZWJ7_9DIPT